jgi:hypothetical protein
VEEEEAAAVAAAIAGTTSIVGVPITAMTLIVKTIAGGTIASSSKPNSMPTSRAGGQIDESENQISWVCSRFTPDDRFKLFGNGSAGQKHLK